MVDNISRSTPFTHGDLVRGENGRTEQYFGPSFRVDFPEGTDVKLHSLVLEGLGYRTKVDSERKSSIFLYGNFSEAEIKDYEENYGAKTKLIKAKGVCEPRPWD